MRTAKGKPVSRCGEVPRSPKGGGGNGSAPSGGWIGPAIALATFTLFSRCLGHDFVRLDDPLYVTENAVVLGGFSWEGVRWAFGSVHASNWHPLTWLSHMVDVTLFGQRAWGHHLSSIVLHSFNAWLLYSLLVRMTKRRWASAMAALLFGIHPLHVASVAWIAQRKDVLSTFLGLLTLHAYAAFARDGRGRDYVLSATYFALGLLAKPMLVTLPFVFLLLDYWPLRRWGRGGSTVGDGTVGRREGRRSVPTSLVRLVVEKVPFFVLAGASCAVTIYAQRRGGAMVTTTLLPLDARLAHAAVAYVTYLVMTAWPSGLCVYYPHPFTRPGAIEAGLSVLVLAAATIAAIASAKTRPYVTVGWFWFVGTLVPVIGVVQVGSQLMADRYSYVPLMGVFVALAWTVDSVIAESRRDARAVRRRVTAVVAGVGLFLAGVTWRQSGYWKDSVTLFQRVLDVTSKNAPAHTFMAQTLFPLGREEEAIGHYEEAVRISPHDADSCYNLGYAYSLKGRLEDAGRMFREAFRLRPDHAHANFHLGRMAVEAGRHEAAVGHLMQALATDRTLLGGHELIGQALYELGRFDEAVSHLLRWLEVSPGATATRFRLGRSLFILGAVEDAAEELATVVKQTPNDPYAHAALGQALTPLGRIGEALEAYEMAMVLKPDFVEAINNVARIRATYRDGRFRDGAKAVELALRACELTEFGNAVALDTLAAAYAEMGWFDQATTTEEKALSQAQVAGNAEMATLLQGRLELFRRHEPLREPSDLSGTVDRP